MKIPRTKIRYLTIILPLLLTVTLFAMPMTYAHYPGWNVETICYASVTNNVIGLNQPEVITFWTNAIPPTAVGAYGDRWTFTVEFTKPDGSKRKCGTNHLGPSRRRIHYIQTNSSRHLLCCSQVSWKNNYRHTSRTAWRRPKH